MRMAFKAARWYAVSQTGVTIVVILFLQYVFNCSIAYISNKLDAIFKIMLLK